MDQMDPDLKALFNRVGISEEQLRDKDTANFIYDFIENHGGVNAVKSEKKPDIFSNVSSYVPPPPSRSTAPVPNANRARTGK